ncbi:cell division protein FtsQ/DivIB [Psychrobacter sp. I-STPA6b]|uniref:cell division protein FtsQ/DivIB n=1 Tax=Psychrobacter sp. I-STPA6b TaxID=2585718 RepID=UPI001D0C003D|nr:cell division protein FtsQ/DivIB [Psychrobacter sp. I-STPA6b]
MSQTVERVSELSSDGENISETDGKENTMEGDNKTQKKFLLTFLPSILQTKANLMIALMMLCIIVVAIIMVVKSLYEVPPTQLVVDHSNLTPAQYQSLNTAMQGQEVGNFFTTQLPELRDAVMQLPWVNEVSIQRDWHKGIVVSALPRQPIAKFGTERLIDASGQVYVPADSQMLKQPEFVNLQGDSEQSPLIMQMMQQVNTWFAPAGLEVQDVILSPRMTWLIRFNNGLRVIVDNENTYQKLFNASQILLNQLAEKQDEIQTLDLRYKNGFAISWKSDMPASSSGFGIREDILDEQDTYVDDANLADDIDATSITNIPD